MVRALIGLVALTLAGVPAAAEPARWVPQPNRSTVGFDASHPLGDFSGWAYEVAGEFQGDAADLRKGVSGWLSVNPTALRTGLAKRDRDLRDTLEAERHPEIRFTLGTVRSSFPSIGEKSDVLLTIEGVLTIRGVERPASFQGRARLRDGRIWVRGETKVKLTEFGISPPRRFILAVGDQVQLRFDLTLAREP
jgi:polyisoprenoid-binding protein YceI